MDKVEELRAILGAEEIMKIIPHRPPFLLVDRIVELIPGKRSVGIKVVRDDEYYLRGHFPGNPIMPGVLILEALAQTGAVAELCLEENKGKIVLFGGIDSLRFRRQVVPGDTLVLEIEITKKRGPVGKGTARATVDGEIAAEGELTFIVK
ncbi:MAG: 3-hydroxyacyl-ACP dehydratase FabZ [Actinobacteria bacterium]|nr:3-hydroxyacyl-ACP dehydratase FabZ [Actinomycetota bacterium]